MIYDKFPEKARELGDIDIVGIVSENDRTAVMVAGAKVLKKYFDGTKKVQLTLQITAMGGIDKQKDLIGRLSGILNSLVYGEWDIEGITQPRCRITNFPTPTVKNAHYWIYTAGVNIDFYTKEVI